VLFSIGESSLGGVRVSAIVGSLFVLEEAKGD
jgi:hypothetical protein